MNNVIDATARFLARRRKTTASVVARIEKNVDDLISVAQRETEASNNALAHAYALQQRAREHSAEAERAMRVAQRMTDLVK